MHKIIWVLAAVFAAQSVSADIIFAEAENSLVFLQGNSSNDSNSTVIQSSGSSGGRRITPTTPTSTVGTTCLANCTNQSVTSPAPTQILNQVTNNTSTLPQTILATNPKILSTDARMPEPQSPNSTLAIFFVLLPLLAIASVCTLMPERIPGLRVLTRNHFYHISEITPGHAVFVSNPKTAAARITAAAHYMPVCVITTDATPHPQRNVTNYTISTTIPTGALHADAVLTALASLEEFLERKEYGLIAITCLDSLGSVQDATIVASLLHILRAHLNGRGAIIACATEHQSWESLPAPIRACFDTYEASYLTP